VPLRIRLPFNNWQPRLYQKKLWTHLENGGQRAVAVWHRRSGKDEVALHWTACAMHRRIGTYWHMLPEASQARKAIWEAINPHTGKRRIDEAFPPAVRSTTRDNEMFIRIRPGSTWQVIGSDNYNSLVGSPPVGVVFSEWALADPQAWAYVRPILRENGGWAVFIYTPRGRNHGATFYEGHQGDPAWFVERLRSEDTGLFTAAELATELREYVTEYGQEDGTNLFNQEYHCDFNAAVVGSYYGPEMTAAERDKRICPVPYEPKAKVYTAWDLGIGDSTAIWFVQFVGKEIRCIDYLENSGVGLTWYAKQLQERPYVYAEHILPHDADVKELGTGVSRLETLHSLGLFNHRVMPARAKADSINGVRLLLPRCWFDKVKCQRGVDALRQYRKEWDEKRKVFHDRPLHDWASHGSDAFAELAAAGITGDDAWSRKLDYSKISKGIV